MTIRKSTQTEEDRISLLPDCLLHEILSFLNTKSVVQTCVLSKRWKTLWTEIPTLNFDYNSSYSFSIFKTEEDDISKQTSFKNFIIRVLSKLRTKSIRKLAYTSSKNRYDLTILADFLISYARSHSVQQLFLNTFNVIESHFWDFCINVNTCSSLVHLKLVCVFADNLDVLALPSLKILEIESLWLERPDKRANHKEITMFPGCPNLESLVFFVHLFQTATISAPKLKNLKLCASPDNDPTFSEVQLLTPTLENISFVNVLPTVKSDYEFSRIDKVDIQLVSRFERDDRNSRKSKFRELLSVFHMARSFTLPLKLTMQVMSLDNFDALCFHNMKHLRLRTKETGLLLEQLLKAPNLENFRFVKEVRIN
ncbi:hypothetical protein Csa_008454 [Cucumis sativus]|nr:hypothetical protein Csa_008454 [Cucumis sativus]